MLFNRLRPDFAIWQHPAVRVQNLNFGENAITHEIRSPPVGYIVANMLINHFHFRSINIQTDFRIEALIFGSFL